jgi:putative ABC transport system substrate-binding protein
MRLTDRRSFISTVVLGLALAPLAAEAQQARTPYRVGFLTGSTPPHLVEAFRQGLRELGWNEGQNFVLEYRSAESRFERVPGLAAELVQRKVDVLVVTATSVYDARQVAATVPTIFIIPDDPVNAGFVASLARPGGHMTGVTSLNLSLDAKRLEIPKMAVPAVVRVGVVSSPHDRATQDRVVAAEQAARSLGLKLQFFEVASADMLPSVFNSARRARVGALMVLGSPVLLTLQPRISEFATKAGLPVISAWRDFPDAGGLMSYGTNAPAMFRRAASYVDRILKGAKPADLPIEQPTKFELVINLKTAKALGLTIPPSLLQRADQVIE